MEDDFEMQLDAKKRQRIIERLDTMVAAGRLTDEESRRLRAASEPDEFDAVIRDVRVRHARARMATAVEDGSLTQAEADGFLESLRKGEHPRSLRTRLRNLRPGDDPGPHLPTVTGPADDRPRSSPK